MSGGKNGATPSENLSHLRSKPVHAVPAELEYSKCPAHPTKRMWTDAREAVIEAEVRSESARMSIVAIRCASCYEIHLCKETNAHAGTIITRDSLYPAAEPPLVLGNADAKRKVLSEYLAEHSEPETEELLELLGVGRSTLGAYMREAGWYNTRGRFARWVQDERPGLEPPTLSIVEPQPAPVTELEASIARHPASSTRRPESWVIEQFPPNVDVQTYLRTLTLAGLTVEVRAWRTEA